MQLECPAMPGFLLEKTMRKKYRRLLVNGLLVAAIASMAACSAVSFTHANGAKGQSITNAEVQPDNTVVLTYPNGSACIDANPGESQTCKGQ
ncbi:hypothetical protein MMB10_21905 [Salmonella enterica]|nr:hypothetical protein [Salmonella enterica]HCC4195787.1 hypothetical protein [Salmonella enterica]